jgi:hypothetical protein
MRVKPKRSLETTEDNEETFRPFQLTDDKLILQHQLRCSSPIWGAIIP